MNVRLGWSGEIQGTWTKMDIEVDDTDLLLFFEENEIDPEAHTYTSLQKFKILYTTAEKYVQLQKMSKFPAIFDNIDGRNELGKLLTEQRNIANAIKGQSVN